jgi:hypothetical protein
MASYKFRDFCEVKQFVTLCGHHKIEVEPFVQKLKSIAENVELSEQERYDELLQAAKNAASLVGNKISQGAGAAARGIGQAVGAGWGVLQNGANNIQKGFAAGQALANGMGAPGAANVAGQQQNSGMPNPNQPNATVDMGMGENELLNYSVNLANNVCRTSLNAVIASRSFALAALTSSNPICKLTNSGPTKKKNSAMSASLNSSIFTPSSSFLASASVLALASKGKSDFSVGSSNFTSERRTATASSLSSKVPVSSCTVKPLPWSTSNFRAARCSSDVR